MCHDLSPPLPCPPCAGQISFVHVLCMRGAYIVQLLAWLVIIACAECLNALFFFCRSLIFACRLHSSHSALFCQHTSVSTSLAAAAAFRRLGKFVYCKTFPPRSEPPTDRHRNRHSSNPRSLLSVTSPLNFISSPGTIPGQLTLGPLIFADQSRDCRGTLGHASPPSQINHLRPTAYTFHLRSRSPATQRRLWRD